MPSRWTRTAVAALLVAGALLGAAPAAASTGPGAVRPAVDPAAPTPTAPLPGGPPQGFAPDGSTAGGPVLNTRGLVLAPGGPPLPDGITAPGWLVADLDTGAVLAARDPHGRYYPASTLKTLTLLTLTPRLPVELVVEGTADDEQIEGSRVGLVEGGRYPVGLLFQALVMESGNDVAQALSRAAGGVPATVAAMNATAQRLGAYDTVAGTPSGLDVAGQSSSPYDLALIFRALLADPTAAAVLRAGVADMPPAGGRPGFQIQSQNPLLSDYPGDLGGKDGYTDAARHTFVTAAERNGRRLVASVMGTENRPVADSEQAARLLTWGFSVPAGAAGVGRLAGPVESSSPVAAEAGGTPAARTPAPAAQDLGAPAARTSARSTWPWVAAAVAVGAVLVLGWTGRRPRRSRPRGAGPREPSLSGPDR